MACKRLMLAWLYAQVLGIYRLYMLGLYRDNGKQNGKD